MTTPTLFKEYIWLVNTIYQARSYGAGKKEIVSQFKERLESAENKVKEGRNGDWLHCAPEIAIILASLW